jgi:ArsR family transcriptional regulator
MILRVLGNAKRFQILELLLDGEKCTLELMDSFKVTQPTLSHDLKRLQTVGVIKPRKSGKRTYYSIDRDVLSDFIVFLKNSFELFPEVEGSEYRLDVLAEEA